MAAPKKTATLLNELKAATFELERRVAELSLGDKATIQRVAGQLTELSRHRNPNAGRGKRMWR